MLISTTRWSNRRSPQQTGRTVEDVYITIQKETDAGIYVSGAKVVATNSALTNYNFLGQNISQEITDPAMVVMFIAPMNTPGIKPICRPSYELAAAATGSPWDYPLTSGSTRTTPFSCLDNAFIPWENVLIHRDIDRLKIFYPSPASSTASRCRAAPARGQARFHLALSTRRRAPPASRRFAACRRRSAK